MAVILVEVVSVPAMVHYLRKDICTLGIEYHNFNAPTMVDVNSTVCYLRTDICAMGIG